MLNAGVLLKMSRNTASFAYGFPQSAFKLKHYQLNSTQSIEYLRNTIAMGKATVNMQPKRHPLCGEAWDHAKLNKKPFHLELKFFQQQHPFRLLIINNLIIISLKAKTAKFGSICG